MQYVGIFVMHTPCVCIEAKPEQREDNLKSSHGQNKLSYELTFMFISIESKKVKLT